ncbi:hypothetical protein SAMN05660691_01603 [Rheinheimera pacifica]|uniref:Uncharacterized protein n=1 Tax=Rheinheimera pacifica TaxID=173990 RepID=A0A1H6KZ83_9GAMM|nr:hypothetical protein [Rheinheimera pacifica]SEH81003.1 hypothetical protein SAMN05660691_01603 [Rheinheimera pacifica]
MFKKLLLITLTTLFVSPFVIAKPSLLMPKKEQAEDFRYYQNFHWNKPVERKALYEAIANGQFHMYQKMMECKLRASHLPSWLDAFKKGGEEIAFTESDYSMRDIDDKQIRDPEDGTLVSGWQVRDFAEKNYTGYTRKSLKKLQDKYWGHCLAELPVNLFTKEAQDKLDARLQREADREMGYP